MSKKKAPDPKRLAILEEIEASELAKEKWYAKLKRSFSGLEKARRRAKNARKRLSAHGNLALSNITPSDKEKHRDDPSHP